MDTQPANTNASLPMPTLDGQLCFALYSANLAMSKVYRRVLKELDITYPQYLVMLTLWETPAMSVSEIGERLFLDSATLTPLLKRLEAAGLVHRQRSRDDERHVVISLTDAGQALKEKAPQVQHGIGCALECTLEEAGQLKNQLQQLRSQLARHA